MDDSREPIDFDLPIGEVLVGIEYARLALEPDLVPGALIDNVWIALTLVFAPSGPSTFLWEMERGAGYLTVQRPWPGRDDAEACDVSERWAPLIGQTLRGQTVVMHETDAGWRPWSCRLTWSESDSLVIALGECDEAGIPVYSVDNLVVTADRATAEGYRIREGVAATSAWGADPE